MGSAGETLVGRHRFGTALALISVAALAWRIVFVLVWGPTTLPFGDGLQYHLAATVLANGHGFTNSILYSFAGGTQPSAAHPPMYTLLLAAVTRGGRTMGLGEFDSARVHQIASAVFSSAGVVAIGFLGRRIAGARVGLIAAAFAAVYPALWIRDSEVMSESLVVLTTALLLLAIVTYLDRPGISRAIPIGLAAGVAMLTRSEATLLFVALAAGAVLVRHAVGRVVRARHLLCAALVALAVVSPWVLRNLTTFNRPIFLSENIDSVIAGANCHATYYGARIGAWDGACNTADLPRGDESDIGAELRHRGVQYALHRVHQLPLVAAARVGRLLSVYHPLQDDWGSSQWTLWINLIAFALLTAAAVVGGYRLRKNRGPVWLFVVVLAITVLVAALTYGSTRFRIEWDVALVVLAAAAFAHDASRSRAVRKPLSR